MKFERVYALYSDAEFQLIYNNQVTDSIFEAEMDYYYFPLKIIQTDYFKLIVGKDNVTLPSIVIAEVKEIKWIKKVSTSIYSRVYRRYDLEIIESNHEIIELERSLINE